MAIGERIKQARERKDMTQDQVARMLNTTKQTIFKYENNIVTNIPYEKIILLSKVLDVSPSYLFDWKEKEQPSGVGGLSLEGVSQEDIKTIKAYLDMPEDQRRALAKILGVSE